MKENWKKIRSHKGYEVSDHGRVRSYRTNSGKILNNFKIINPIMRNGYPTVCLSGAEKRKQLLIHRLVAIEFIPNPDLKPHVAHLDGTRNNNHVSNLMWATHKENMGHKLIHGTGVGDHIGRPESANPKTEIGRIRLTKEEMMKIQKAHGTFKDFVRAMIKTLPLMAIAVLAMNSAHSGETKEPYMGTFKGDLSIVKKEELVGVAIKAEILRIEYLEGDNELVLNTNDLAVKEKKTELNISIEPDFKVAQIGIMKIEASPLIGFSAKTTKQLRESKVGAACDISNGQIPHSDCFAYRDESSSALNHGASIKFSIEPQERLNFYFKAGAYSNESSINYKKQFSFGASMPF